MCFICRLRSYSNLYTLLQRIKMKRIFCDCCGKEMQYGEGTARLSGKTEEVALQAGRSLLAVEVTIDVVPVKVHNGGHIDICEDCRWTAVWKVDKRPKPAVEQKSFSLTALRNRLHSSKSSAPGEDPVLCAVLDILKDSGIKVYNS
jgi:hypothetical protein